MANYVASLTSLQSSAQQAKECNILRHVSTVGHAAKVVQKLAKEDFVLGHIAKGALDTLEIASKDSKLLQLAGKGIKIAKYTDPISCACAMVRVAKSDTPGRSLLEESSGLLGMFAIEGAMIKYSKDIANIKGVKTLNDKMVNFCKNTKYCGQVPAIAYGLLFTAGSIIGTKLAGKAGKWVADKLKLPESQEKQQLPPEKTKKQYYWG